MKGMETNELGKKNCTLTVSNINTPLSKCDLGHCQVKGSAAKQEIKDVTSKFERLFLD